MKRIVRQTSIFAIGSALLAAPLVAAPDAAPGEAAAPGAAVGPTDADLMNDANTPGDVLTYGMGPRAQRF